MPAFAINVTILCISAPKKLLTFHFIKHNKYYQIKQK